MTSESAQELVAKSARGMVRRKVQEVVEYVHTGRPTEFPNPFTGQMTSLPVRPDAAVFAAKLRAAGLHQDAAFMTALKSFATDIAAAPLMSFFTALDGEGAFEEGVKVELRLADGTPMPGYLHEIFFPVVRDEEQFE